MNIERPLCRVFLSHVDAPAGVAPVPTDELEQLLNALVQRGARLWPKVSLPPETFISYIASRVERGDCLAALSTLRAGELYLAAACVCGDALAIATFEATYFSEIDRAVVQLGGSSLHVDEVKQTLRKEFFVRDGRAEPKIARYSGRGELRGWIRIVALRATQSALSSERRETPVEDETLINLASTGEDPALAFLKDHYRAPFNEAFREALRELPSREQNLLRLHYLDGVTMDQIAALYHVHRITIVRWFGSARHELLRGTRRVLRQRLRIDDAEFESILRLIQSRWDVSLRALVEPLREDRN